MKRRPIASCIAAALALLAYALPVSAAAPIDEFRITEIEQNIRALQTQIREQARLIEQLQRQLGSQPRSSAAGAQPTMNADSSASWLNVASWNRLRSGMTELEVIDVLGTPTQMRVSDDRTTRTLLYALEIGASGFLSGNVVFKDGRVDAVNPPTLK